MAFLPAAHVLDPNFSKLGPIKLLLSVCQSVSDTIFFLRIGSFVFSNFGPELKKFKNASVSPSVCNTLFSELVH